MKRQILKLAAVMFGMCFLASCGYMPDIGKILPDKRSEYKKSESMPDLEIPPDLTADAINDSMNIPNEAPVTLSSYRNPRTPGTAGVSIGTTAADEQLLSLSIPVNLLWPDLLEFIESKNFSIALEDAELGVLETGWSEVEGQAGLQYRYKYRIFAEPGATADDSVLIISQERQTRIDENSDWLDRDKDAELERRFAAEFSLYIDGGGPAAQPATAVASGAGAGATTGRSGAAEGLRVVDAGEGKMYLSIPEASELAWKNTGIALQNSGLQIISADQAEGNYTISGGAPQQSEKKGFFSRLAFWKGDEEAASWQVSLTGVGNRTELIVVNEDNEWEATDEAARILALIRDRYPI